VDTEDESVNGNESEKVQAAEVDNSTDNVAGVEDKTVNVAEAVQVKSVNIDRAEADNVMKGVILSVLTVSFFVEYQSNLIVVCSLPRFGVVLEDTAEAEDGTIGALILEFFFFVHSQYNLIYFLYFPDKI
jgi:hypothetical protein